jgi:HSP20 family protein
VCIKNKIIIGAIVILVGALIFENAYLLGRYNKERAQKTVYTRYRPASAERLPENNLPVFNEMYPGDSFAEMNRIQERINRIFENSFSGEPSLPNIRGNKVFAGSSMIFSNTRLAYIIKVAMPGIDKNAIDIQVEGRQLIISGENKNGKTSKGKNSYSRELSYGDFLSHFILPEDAQISRISSDYKDGILTLIIPRKEKGKINKPSAVKVSVK